jgi:hypothetical protein
MKNKHFLVFPTVFGQIWPKNSQKFTKIGDFPQIVESLSWTGRLVPNSGKSRDFCRIVESLKTLSYSDFVLFRLCLMFYEPASGYTWLALAELIQLNVCQSLLGSLALPHGRGWNPRYSEKATFIYYNYIVTRPGWPDGANFRPLSDFYILWAIFEKGKSSPNNELLFPAGKVMH